MTMKEKEVDVYRDTPIRYLGYANEVGEAFRSVVPLTVVKLSYVIASCYVLADTGHKANRAYKRESGEGRSKKIVLSSLDALLWQSFASVVVPGLAINRICAFTRFLANRATKTQSRLRSPWLATAVGLVSIPIIIRPIDEGVEEIMNRTYRQWTGFHPDEGESQLHRDDSK